MNGAELVSAKRIVKISEPHSIGISHKKARLKRAILLVAGVGLAPKIYNAHYS